MSAKPKIDTDTALEREISAAYDRFIAAGDAERRPAWEAFTTLLAKRSPRRVAQMEKLQGLDKRATFVPREQRR